MTVIPKKAFVLAAGMGNRMKPLTDNCPKPLLEVGGVTMLDRTLDALARAGVKEAVVNTHYMADKIETHLEGRKLPQVTISFEDRLLETGGGVREKISFFGNEAFFVVNTDNIWTDGAMPALERLAAAWDGAKMDMLLLMQDVEKIPGWGRGGDYYMAGETGKPVFNARSDKPANVVFIGPRIVHPRVFFGVEKGAFSFLDLFHKAEEAGRLYGLRHDCLWYHVGTPREYEEVNRILSAPSARHG
jgi:MurNAc alpha-1-phosphate uridylyltransferase